MQEAHPHEFLEAHMAGPSLKRHLDDATFDRITTPYGRSEVLQWSGATVAGVPWKDLAARLGIEESRSDGA